MATEISLAGGTTSSRAEGNSGSTPFTFTVLRSGDTTGTSSVSYNVNTAGLTATSGDFVGGVLPSGVLSFAANETSKTITILVSSDPTFEPDETFSLTLSSPVGGTLKSGADIQLVTILNDDPGTQNGVLTLSGPANLAEQPFSATYTVTRTSTAESASYSYSMIGSGVSPISGADFANGQLPSGVLTFAPGAATANFDILVPVDGVFEPTEQFGLTITSTSGFVTYATLFGNVKDTTYPASTITVTGPGAKNEGNSGTTTFDFVVSRTGDISGTGSVHYTTANVSTQASDFVGGILPSGTVTFGAGESSKTISIGVAGDTLAEGDEVFNVALDNGVNLNLGSNSSALATILNDDGSNAPVLALSGSSGTLEGTAGSSSIRYTVVRTGNLTVASTVTYIIDTSSSTAGAEDFLGGKYPSGQLSFAPGETSKTFEISTSFDKVPEPDKTYTVILQNPTGASIGSGRVVSTIYDDDRPDILSSFSSGGDVTEGGTFTYTIGRNDASQAYSFTYSVEGSAPAAADAADFVGGVLPSGTVNFGVGEFTKTISIATNADSTLEIDESFRITFRNGYSPNTLFGSVYAVGISTIYDDDDPNIASWTVLGSAFSNILNSTPSSDAAFLGGLTSQMASGALTQAQALDQVIARADGTTSVATLAYEFFTGKIPSQAGMTYLVSPTGPNPNNLNSAYYQSFSVENRYINFAVNLGKEGEGATRFAADYGALDLTAATTKAYQTIFGTAPTADKVRSLLDPTFVLNGVTMTRAEYFAYYGGDGPNGIGAKAAMVGWLLAEAEKADIGMYAKANHAFLLDLADGATFGVDLVGVYGKPEFAL